MVKFVEGVNPDDPGVARINYAIGFEHTPEFEAHLERLQARKTAEEARLAARKDVPARRKPPGNNDTLVSWSDEEVVFAQDQNRDVELILSRLRVYPTGIRFDLIAREQDEGKATFIGERINLTHRIRRPFKHRIYLGIVLPDGKIVTNKKCTPPQAPEDDDLTTPWLYGGKSYSRQSETGATYFLSPRPEDSSELVFTIAYPEIGIDRASSIALDCTRFTRSDT
ncbi:hypothetical protein [Rhodococcus sp. USK13]|uniref:hypothetical protein n=1 Tax=Rhodococcus sp. USK13 TaxID=2806442 RepID=UPI001BCACBE3|nr:hypothetical protein [Rhodococcus sp. USK13]